MDSRLLIDAIVRQTTVLIAQLATSGGGRAQLAHTANQVFLDLVDALKEQGLGNKVIADMFGMALRTYQTKLQRLSESRTDRGRSLWEALFAFVQEQADTEAVARATIMQRFRHDDPLLVGGVLRDLVDSGLLHRSGRGDFASYGVAQPPRGANAVSDQEQLLGFVWMCVHRLAPATAAQVARTERPTPGKTAAGPLLPERSGFLALPGENGLFYRIDATGHVLRELPPPAGAVLPTYDTAVAFDDGSLLMAGRVDGHVWLGKVDATWTLVWERELTIPAVVRPRLAALPDGGAVVFALEGVPAEIDGPPSAEAVHWARISSQGDQLWQRQEPTQNSVLNGVVASTGNTIHIAASWGGGVHLVSSDLDGTYEAPLVDVPSPYLEALLALPNDQLALIAHDEVRVFDAAQQLVWQHSFAGAFGWNAVYEPVRDEIVVVGEVAGGGGGSWAEGLSRLGDVNWSLARDPVPLADGVYRPEPDYTKQGEPLDDICADGEGHLAAQAPFTSLNLTIMWVDAGRCGG